MKAVAAGNPRYVAEAHMVLSKKDHEVLGDSSGFRQWLREEIILWLPAQEKMVAEATKRGMEEVVDAVPGAPLSGSGVARMPNNTGTRPLVRSDTNDEFERVKKKGPHGR